MNNAVSYMIINDLKPIFLPVIAFALSVHNPWQFFHSKPSFLKIHQLCNICLYL